MQLHLSLLRRFILISLAIIPMCANSQNFSWEKGDKLSGQSGTYGTQGVPNNANNPSGRQKMGSWRDLEGNLWLFGGDRTVYSSSQNYLNDLLKYDLSTKQWTWVKGNSYNSNNLGIYGTQGLASMANKPGSRKGPATWTDFSGNLWLFGGYGFAELGSYNFLNDLWMYDPATNMWTWIRGSNGINQSGTYGTKGVFASGNMPGSRTESVTWVDGKGNFWLFGGEGRDANGTYCNLNDIWCFDPAIKQWAWMAGNSTNTYFGKYGTQGVSSPSVFPGGRYASGSFADTANACLYLFGGYGYGDMYDVGGKFLSDLWKYDINTGYWTWIKGSTSSGQPTVYGTKGVPSLFGSPGGRFGFAYTSDPSGAFWVFGGIEDGQGSANIYLHDLWKYDPKINRWIWYGGSTTGNQYGVYGNLGIPDATNLPGGRAYSTAWCDVAGNIYLFGGEGRSESNWGFLNDLWKYGNCTPESFHISTTNTLLCVGESATLSINSNHSPLWNTNETSTSIVISPSVTSSYTVDLMNVEDCNFSIEYTQVVSECTNLSHEINHHNDLMIYPNPNTGNFSLRTSLSFEDAFIQIRNVLGQLVFEQKINSNEVNLQTKLNEGVYFYSVQKNDQILHSGKISIH